MGYKVWEIPHLRVGTGLRAGPLGFGCIACRWFLPGRHIGRPLRDFRVFSVCAGRTKNAGFKKLETSGRIPALGRGTAKKPPAAQNPQYHSSSDLRYGASPLRPHPTFSQIKICNGWLSPTRKIFALARPHAHSTVRVSISACFLAGSCLATLREPAYGTVFIRLQKSLSAGTCGHKEDVLFIFYYIRISMISQFLFANRSKLSEQSRVCGTAYPAGNFTAFRAR